MFVLSSSLRQLSRASVRCVTLLLLFKTLDNCIYHLNILPDLISPSPSLLHLSSSPKIRSFSSAAASTSNAAEIDWSAVRAKMMTEETRADADRAKEAFQKRLSAATSVGQVAEVDWSYFKKGELMGY